MKCVEGAGAVESSFVRVHDAYLEAWRDGLARGDASVIEPYYRGLRSVLYARPGWDALEPVEAAGSVEGLRQTVAALTGWRHVVSDRAVLVRDVHEVAVFFRKVIETDGQAHAAFMLQVWRDVEKDGASWTLIRETVEK